MAAMTTAIVAGTGALMSFHGAQQQAQAAKRAGKFNAQEAERQAQLAREQAIQDEKQFRLSFRRDQAKNKVAIGASGVKLEGSPLEVLRDNAASAEQDAINIRRGGEIRREGFLGQAAGFRRGAKDTVRAARIQGAASLLSGAVNTYDTGKKAGTS